ncbi:MAG: efflux RND transporter periplasmic adaptor subunit, partial [Gammaproteobacteria bacterium]|nr:efflux RND transporter periplasmic adaptor subunit [Gammaproteobacteria bacterium]
MKKSTWLTLVVLLIAGIAAGVALLRPKPVRVAISEVDRGTVTASVSNTRAGTVNACRRAGIAPAFGGQLAILNVKTGDAVTVNQVLLELWNDDIRAELLLAQRDALAARRRADEACVRADVAQREAERLTSLLKRGLSSEEETDRAEGDARAKSAGCKAAREAARVNDAKVEVAEARLERTILRAPFDGVIAEINGELGEYVTPSPVGIPTPPTVDLIDDSCLYISAPIDEVDAPLVRAGQTAAITMDAFPAQRFDAV